MLIAATVGFLFGFIGSMPVAGPIAVLVFARAVEGRTRSGFYIAVGGAIAEGAYALLAFWGFSELLASYPIMVPISRGAAALILAVLGISFLRRRTATDRPVPERKEGWGGSFVLGFTITALNPTLIATWTAAVTTLFSTGMGFHQLMAVPFGVSAVVGIIGWFTLLLYLVRRYRERISERTLDKILRVMGLMLVGLSVWFLVSFILYWVHR